MSPIKQDTMMIRVLLMVMLGVLYAGSTAVAATTNAFPTFKKFVASATGHAITLGNNAISVQWSLVDGHLKPAKLRDGLSNQATPLGGELFELKMKDGSIVKASQLHIIQPPQVSDTVVDTKSARLASGLPGKQVKVELEDTAHTLRVKWIAIGRDGGEYVRTELVVKPVGKAAVPLREIVMFDGALAGATLSGPAKGPVVVAGNTYLALESPLGHASITGDAIVCGIDRSSG